jgi:hypothetical protein
VDVQADHNAFMLRGLWKEVVKRVEKMRLLVLFILTILFSLYS